MADPGKHKRPLYPPTHPKGPVPDGDDVVAIKRALARAQLFPWKGEGYDDTYNEAISDAVAKFQKANGIEATGNYGKPTHDKLRLANVPGGPNGGQDVFDNRSAALYANYLDPSAVPDLGPMFRGGKPVLYQDLTHATSGIPLYPAFDDAFSEGVVIIAPELIEVTKASSSNPGDACYATGVSQIKWWFGHLTAAPAVGARIAQSERIGVTCPNNLGGGPHVHVAMNVERLWGAGKQLTHHVNYTHGAPLIGEQLEAGRPLA